MNLRVALSLIGVLITAALVYSITAGTRWLISGWSVGAIYGLAACILVPAAGIIIYERLLSRKRAKNARR